MLGEGARFSDAPEWLKQQTESKHAAKQDRNLAANLIIDLGLKGTWTTADVLAIQALKARPTPALLYWVCNAKNLEGLDVLIAHGVPPHVLISALFEECGQAGNMVMATRLAQAVHGTKSVEARECMEEALRCHRVDVIDLLQTCGICAPWSAARDIDLFEAVALGDLSLVAKPVLQSATCHRLSQALSIAIEMDHVACAQELLTRYHATVATQKTEGHPWPNPVVCAAAKKERWALDLVLPHLTESCFSTVLVFTMDPRWPEPNTRVAGGGGPLHRRDDPIDVALDQDFFDRAFLLARSQFGQRCRVLPSLCCSVSGDPQRELRVLPHVREWITFEPDMLCWKCIFGYPLDWCLHCGTFHIMSVLIDHGALLAGRPPNAAARTVLQLEIDRRRVAKLAELLSMDLVAIVSAYLLDDIDMCFHRPAR